VRAGQDWETQEERMKHGACPIHGIGMSQVIGNWYRFPDSDTQFTIVGCPRKDCDVHGIQADILGPVTLLYEDVPVIALECGNCLDGDGFPDWCCFEPPVEIWPAQILARSKRNKEKIRKT